MSTARPMKIQAVSGSPLTFKVSNDRFSCLIYRAVRLVAGQPWDGEYVWFHKNLDGTPIPDRKPFRTLKEAYAWVCESQGIAPLF